MWTPTRIKELRKRYGENQEQFSKRFRLSISAIQYWEQGHSDPSGPATVILDILEAEVAARDLQTAAS